MLKQTNKQTNKHTIKQMAISLEMPFLQSSATLNKKANILTFSECKKSYMCHVSWRFSIQVCVVTYITRTLPHRAELKAYWHFRHSVNYHEIKKAAGKILCIITLISQKILLEAYILCGKEIPEAVTPQ